MSDPFAFDGRGNRLLAWEVVDGPWRVLICAQTAIYRQVHLWLLNQRVQPRTAAFEDVNDPARWTHCLAIDRVPDGLDAFLELLKRIVILCNLPASIEAGAALDFYKVPSDDVPSRQWPNTEIGDLVYSVKYGMVGDSAKTRALDMVASQMSEVVMGLPSFLIARSSLRFRDTTPES